MYFKACLPVTLFALLTACSSKPETYTTDYLYENDDVRAEVLADCIENKQTPENCQAANDAENKKQGENYFKKTGQKVNVNR